MTSSPEKSRIIVCDIDDMALHVSPRHLVLWNDETSTYQTVFRVLIDVLGYTKSRAIDKIVSIEIQGKGVVFTGPREVSELPSEQFHEEHLITSLQAV